MKNTNRNHKVVSTNTVTVQTHSWKAFGNQIVCKFAALNEIIQNAIAAIIRYTIMMGITDSRYFADNHVDVSIKHLKHGTYLYVQNNGIVADLRKVLDYGRLNRDTALNQHGTGFKTAASFFNPTNDSWAFYTRDAEHVYRVCAPYSTEMIIEEIEEWPFSDWAVSCVEIKVDDDITMNDITAKELGFRYAFAIKNGVNLTFNDKIVRPVMPNGIDMKDHSFVAEFNGENVKFECKSYIVTDTEASYYAKSEIDQGLYIFVNDCFVENSGVSLIRKRDGEGNVLRSNSTIKRHPSMNGMIATINILLPDNHNVNIPFANTKNAINWSRAKDIAYAIDDNVGYPFAKAYRMHYENERRKPVDYTCKKLAHKDLFLYEMEVEVGYGLKADAVMYKKQNADGSVDKNSIHTILEFKSSKINGSDVGQAMNYLFALNTCYPATFERRVMMVGPSLTEDAKCAIRTFRSAGYDVDFMELPTIYEDI